MLGTGESTPNQALEDALAGKSKFEYLGQTDPAKPDLTVAVITDTRRDELTFDPDRGYILTRWTTRTADSDRLAREIRLLEAKPSSNGRWLPTHVVKVMPIGTSTARLFEMKVTSFNAGYQRVKADMELELPPNTNIHVPSNNLPQSTRTNRQKSERYGPDQLAQLHQRCVATGQRYAATRVARDQQREAVQKAVTVQKPKRWKGRTILLLANGAALAVIGTVLAIRFVRNRRDG